MRPTCPEAPRGKSPHHPRDPSRRASQPAAAQGPLPRLPLSTRGRPRSLKEASLKLGLTTMSPATRPTPVAASALQNQSYTRSRSSPSSAIRAAAAPPPISAQNSAGSTWLVPPLPRQREGRGREREGRGDRQETEREAGDARGIDPGEETRREEASRGRCRATGPWELKRKV